jgi:hypothetical protein
VEGMPENELEQAWKRGDRSAVLDSAARIWLERQTPKDTGGNRWRR